MKPETIYIAGPMTGLPECNFPAFHAAEEALHLLRPDSVILNPARNPKAPPNMAEAETWRHYMRFAIQQVAQSDAVVWLDGWERSTGAKLEFEIADRLGLGRWRIVGGLLFEYRGPGWEITGRCEPR